jgi:hypothetical protein
MTPYFPCNGYASLSLSSHHIIAHYTLARVHASKPQYPIKFYNSSLPQSSFKNQNHKILIQVKESRCSSQSRSSLPWPPPASQPMSTTAKRPTTTKITPPAPAVSCTLYFSLPFLPSFPIPFPQNLKITTLPMLISYSSSLSPTYIPPKLANPPGLRLPHSPLTP